MKILLELVGLYYWYRYVRKNHDVELVVRGSDLCINLPGLLPHVINSTVKHLVGDRQYTVLLPIGRNNSLRKWVFTVTPVRNWGEHYLIQKWRSRDTRQLIGSVSNRCIGHVTPRDNCNVVKFLLGEYPEHTKSYIDYYS